MTVMIMIIMMVGGDGSPSWLRVWLLDLAILDESHVVVLAAAVNQNDGTNSRQQVHYGLCQLKVSNPPNNTNRNT